MREACPAEFSECALSSICGSTVRCMQYCMNRLGMKQQLDVVALGNCMGQCTAPPDLLSCLLTDSGVITCSAECFGADRDGAP